jgi:hypothetical protein
MVVLSVCLMTKPGKMLLAREFVPMSRLRIESLVAAFPKLVEADSQHTFIETDDVRYVFQPLDALNLVLITNKQSNIIDDLETLQMMAKLVGEHCPSPTEEGVNNHKFELIFALDEVLALGHKEAVTLQQIKTFIEMDSHEEKLHQIIMESKMNEAREAARKAAEENAEKRRQAKALGQDLYANNSGSSSSSAADNFSSRYSSSSSASSNNTSSSSTTITTSTTSATTGSD